MTKTDLDNPTYKGIVLASPGIGKNYINRWDAKRNTYKTWKSEYDKTDETYRFRNGEKAALPKYYKDLMLFVTIFITSIAMSLKCVLYFTSLFLIY